MQLSQFQYHLPIERIAQNPVTPRDHSRLLMVNRDNDTISHHHFYDLPTLLRPGDLLVLNNSKVLPVRLLGKKTTGGNVEVLLIKKLVGSQNSEVWEALTKPGLKPGQEAVFANDGWELRIRCEQESGYTRQVSTSVAGDTLLRTLLHVGSIPTPPYITEFVGNDEQYQTVFAKRGGSAAAPTAGLHFTPELFGNLQQQGIDWTEVTLHVGLGTFLPVKATDITQHQMHAEWFEITAETAAQLNAARRDNRRIIAVGTTAMRTLESAVQLDGTFAATARETELYVYPPYQFQACDGMITNFHLPESTLLMLVSAFTTAPQSPQEFTDFATSLLGRAYHEAIQQKYRFFSFGDAMLIV